MDVKREGLLGGIFKCPSGLFHRGSTGWHLSRSLTGNQVKLGATEVLKEPPDSGAANTSAGIPVLSTMPGTTALLDEQMVEGSGKQ